MKLLENLQHLEQLKAMTITMQEQLSLALERCRKIQTRMALPRIHKEKSQHCNNSLAAK